MGERGEEKVLQKMVLAHQRYTLVVIRKMSRLAVTGVIQYGQWHYMYESRGRNRIDEGI